MGKWLRQSQYIPALCTTAYGFIKKVYDTLQKLLGNIDFNVIIVHMVTGSNLKLFWGLTIQFYVLRQNLQFCIGI